MQVVSKEILKKLYVADSSKKIYHHFYEQTSPLKVNREHVFIEKPNNLKQGN